MIEQTNNDVKFLAFFIASKVGKTGLADVTVDVYNPAGSEIVTGGSASEVGDGLYSYTLTANLVATMGEYPAVFKTADATVDQQHIPALWVVGRAGVENLDASIDAITPGLTQGPDETVIAAAVWDEDLTTHVTANSAGALLTTAGSASDPLNNPVPGAYAEGSAGYVIGRIGTADLATQGPVSADGGTLTLVRGDDYTEDLGREITFSSESWPDLTNSFVEITIRRRREAFGTGSDGVLVNAEAIDVNTIGNAQVVTFELNTALTTTLLPGVSTGKFDVQAILADNSVVTLVTGLVTVTEDQTRTNTVPA